MFNTLVNIFGKNIIAYKFSKYKKDYNRTFINFAWYTVIFDFE